MKQMFSVIACLLLTCLASQLDAQQDMGNPHDGSAATTGVIIGRLYDHDKEPLGRHRVVLEIFHGKNFVLAIPKDTTLEGDYRFKNIFRRPEFSYFISARYNDGLYRTPAISLKPGEKERRADLVMGAQSKVAAQPMQSVPHAHGQMIVKRTWWPFDVYQTLAVLLSIVAVGYVIYVLRRKPGTRP